MNPSSSDLISPNAEIEKETEELSSAFESIATTLGFIHHEGTDQGKELDIIKCILMREGIIMKLKNICHKVSKCEILVQNPDNLELELLEALSGMRTTTTIFVELLCAWRQSAADYEPHNLKTFLWEGHNYTLKVTTDLDFLAEQPLIVAALHFPPEKMIKNPLMLPNSLEEGDTWISAMERASSDSCGLKEGSIFEERLRIRKAERVLLQELELNINEDIVPEWDVEHYSSTKNAKFASFGSKENSLGGTGADGNFIPSIDITTVSGNTTGESSSVASSSSSFSSSLTSSRKDSTESGASGLSSSFSSLQKWKYDVQEQLHKIEKLRSEQQQQQQNEILSNMKIKEYEAEEKENDKNYLDEPNKLSAFLSSYSASSLIAISSGRYSFYI